LEYFKNGKRHGISDTYDSEGLRIKHDCFKLNKKVPMNFCKDAGITMLTGLFLA